MSTASTILGQRFHLTEGQRATLLELIAVHPDDSIEGIRRRFTERTGRAVGAETVRVAWVQGYATPGPKSRLTEGQRATLAELCSVSPRGYGSVPAIALAFFEATGRGVDPTTVRAYRRRLTRSQRIEGRRAANSPAPSVTSPTQILQEQGR